ncbi:Putative signal transducing protein [Mesonia phycicola]|uniref:Putative signal transducing protein n=1 Tax=Mesonia phycicola TaxID=579105 RepID=A0A1M6HAU0_9FLAO|nr:DUF2007 domain-containing protein [Mesonia phycicola]SHJ19276.1 Putative signal transducing protein [Mesonia phycicola]
MEKFSRILTDSSIIVNRIAYLLQDNNIDYKIKDNVESARLAGFGSPNNNVELYVLKNDLEKSKVLIDNFLKENIS